VAKKKLPAIEKPEKAMLAVPREEAWQKIQTQIDRGNELLNPPFRTERWNQYYRWYEYNYELLYRLFNNNQYAEEYRGFGSFGGGTYTTLADEANAFKRDVGFHVGNLESLRDRLELIPEDPAITHSITVSEKQQMKQSNKVFVVHGHDELAKQSVARFIEKLGLEAIILHEKANLGKTIIEKFEMYADVGFAVILLTPDDVGGSKAANSAGQALNDRARQNVVFEHGFFTGKFGRERVCALYKGVEIPSDLQGVLYVPMDDAENWRFQLAKEMREAGLPVDMNKAL
jgi:predicted nucleotide-binding protein